LYQTECTVELQDGDSFTVFYHYYWYTICLIESSFNTNDGDFSVNGNEMIKLQNSSFEISPDEDEPVLFKNSKKECTTNTNSTNAKPEFNTKSKLEYSTNTKQEYTTNTKQEYTTNTKQEYTTKSKQEYSTNTKEYCTKTKQTSTVVLSPYFDSQLQPVSTVGKISMPYKRKRTLPFLSTTSNKVIEEKTQKNEDIGGDGEMDDDVYLEKLKSQFGAEDEKAWALQSKATQSNVPKPSPSSTTTSRLVLGLIPLVMPPHQRLFLLLVTSINLSIAFFN